MSKSLILKTEPKIALLRLLNEISTEGKFVVVEAEELVSLLAEYALTKAGLKELIDELAERELIAVKYADLDEYCLSVLNKGRLNINLKRDEEAQKSSKRTFFTAFLGGACGALFIELIIKLLEVLFC